MCLSAIGTGATLPTLNRYKNTKTPITEVSNVLETCVLENYGESNGERCGDCCFTTFEQHDMTAIILHNCQTGEIIDFQCPVQGVTCPEGQVCVEMKCWTLGNCAAPAAEPMIDYCCGDPCVIYCQIRNARIKATMNIATGGFLITWRNADKSESYCKPDKAGIEMLKCLEDEFRSCCDDLGCENQSQLMPYCASRPC